MNPGNSYWGMLDSLNEAFRSRYRRKDVNLIGILFARPANGFAAAQVIPNIGYWHSRSGSDTDFFFPGFLHRDPETGGTSVTSGKSLEWKFSDELFVAFLKEIETASSWRYGGGCELIITNARHDLDLGTTSLDLASAIVIDLERASDDKAVQGVSNLCEVFFEFTRNLNQAVGDPCWEFSDRLGLKIVKGSLREFVLNFLPAWLRPDAKKAFYFHTRDLRK